MPVQKKKRKFSPTLVRKNREQEVKEITLDFEDDGELNLTIIPSRFTIGLQRKINKAAETNDLPAMADQFFKVVKGWDMVDEDGEELPLDETSFDELSLDTFFLILQKLGEAIAPKEETSNS